MEHFDVLLNFTNLYKITNLSEVSAIPSYEEMELKFASGFTFEKYKIASKYKYKVHIQTDWEKKKV